jgi:hypothetical protein
MKPIRFSSSVLFASTFAAALLFAGCGKNQTRGNADAQPGGSAYANGPGVSTKGDAGSAEKMGDTDAKKANDLNSPAHETTVGQGSTNGPGANERTDVTIETQKKE